MDDPNKTMPSQRPHAEVVGDVQTIGITESEELKPDLDRFSLPDMKIVRVKETATWGMFQLQGWIFRVINNFSLFFFIFLVLWT